MEDKFTALYEKLSRLQWLLHRHHLQNYSEYGPFADPTRGQGRVLAMLKMQPEISTKDMSYLLGIRQQSLNELLNKLEKAGYVTREPSESDRRVLMVKLTEKGKEEGQSNNTDYTGIFDCLNPEEQSAFGDYLDRVISALECQIGMEDDEEMENWMRAARDRVGGHMFDHFMPMHRGLFDRFGPKGRGPAPEDMPGAERFSPDFDGPMPAERGPRHHRHS
jgi:DNA-binding MarR family transcriptional regulator